MTKEEMQQKKRELGLTYEEIAERCGLSVPTVQRIISGTTENPRTYSRYLIEKVLNNSAVRERPALAYTQKSQGDYTYEDYFELPDDQRCELIDGVIYDLASPTAIHQEICAELLGQLRDHIKKNNGNCRALAAPFDVVADKYSVVQPDVFVICEPKRRDLKGNFLPDFVAEVVSPSSIKRDYYLKVSRYLNAGVKEYWIVDHDKERITVYKLDESAEIKIYSIYEPVPVSIWGGECVIDLSPVKKTEEFLADKGEL